MIELYTENIILKLFLKTCLVIFIRNCLTTRKHIFLFYIF